MISAPSRHSQRVDDELDLLSGEGGVHLRVTSSAIRHVSMRPSNFPRTQEALLSRPPGDLSRSTPVYWSLRAVRGVYYATSRSA